MTYLDETFYQAVKGDQAAIDKTIRQFTPLVHKFVRKYGFMAQGHMYDDLVQEGLLGILKAIRTFDLDYRVNGKPIRPMTWIWPNVRAAVQGEARKNLKHPKYSLSLEQSDWGSNLEDPVQYELKEDFSFNVENLVKIGCGTLDSKRAQIVCDRFGLMGRKALRQGEVAKKYGLSKQATNGHISRFLKKVREEEPQLKELI
jgi:RNA polymerase sigma factor (sigma-70 family)